MKPPKRRLRRRWRHPVRWLLARRQQRQTDRFLVLFTAAQAESRRRVYEQWKNDPDRQADPDRPVVYPPEP